jgi:hypothetical protein
MKGKPRGLPFVCGYDPRRHPLTLKDCRKGYEVSTRQARMPSRTRAWLRKKIRGYYIARKGVAHVA